MKKKKVLCIISFVLMLALLMPSALAVRTADSASMTQAKYTALLDDGGVWDVLAEYNGAGNPLTILLKQGDGAPIPIDEALSIIGGANVQPGLERAVTFRIAYENFPQSTNWDGFRIYMGTTQVAMDLPGAAENISIPLDKGEPNGPRDDRGNVGAAVTVPPSAVTNFGDAYDDLRGQWDGPAMEELYKDYPANALDKIQFTTHAKVVSETDDCPFRNAAGDAIIPRDLDDDDLQWADWMTVQDAQTQDYGNLLAGDVLYIHYTFYWDGSNYSASVKESLVSPEVNRYADANGDVVGNPQGGGKYTINDLYYTGANALYRYDIVVTPPQDVDPPDPPDPPNPPKPPKPPTETPTPTISPSPSDPTPTDPTPPTIVPPDEDGQVTPGVSPTPDGGTKDPDKTSPDMPKTGGFSLFNLFFVGLFLFGVGLIYLKSRKTEEKSNG